MIDLLAASGDSMRFSIRDRSNRHGHLQCRVCGSVVEIPAEHFSDMLDGIERKYRFKVESDHLTFQGVCESCDPEHSARHDEVKHR